MDASKQIYSKYFAIPATTRNWNTITAISDILEVRE